MRQQGLLAAPARRQPGPSGASCSPSGHGWLGHIPDRPCGGEGSLPPPLIRKASVCSAGFGDSHSLGFPVSLNFRQLPLWVLRTKGIELSHTGLLLVVTSLAAVSWPLVGGGGSSFTSPKLHG